MNASSVPIRRRTNPGPNGVFRALADPTRRAILDGLVSAPATAGEIAARFHVSRPAVSKHLRVLHQASLVRVTSHGRRRLYTLSPLPLLVIDDWLTRYRLLWAAQLVSLKQFVESPHHPPHSPDLAAPPAPMQEP